MKLTIESITKRWNSNSDEKVLTKKAKADIVFLLNEIDTLKNNVSLLEDKLKSSEEDYKAIQNAISDSAFASVMAGPLDSGRDEYDS